MSNLSSEENKISIRLIYCKKCNTPIETGGLCEYGCEFDNVVISERPEGSVEVRTFGWIRTDPYVSVIDRLNKKT